MARRPSQEQLRRITVERQIAKIAGGVGYVVAIDPSSTKTGVAVLSVSERLIDAALISGKDGELPEVRGRETAADLEALIDANVTGRTNGRIPPTIAIAVEVPSPTLSAQTKARGGAGKLTSYARAVGRVEAWAERVAANLDRVILIDEKHWTKSRTKEARAEHARAVFPEFLAIRDRGLDVADAIGLGLWVVGEIRLARARTEAA